MPFEAGEAIGFMAEAGFSLSPDGSTLAYRHAIDGAQMIYTRRWDELAATPIRETQGGFFPALSPDATELAFASPNGEVFALALAGGPVRSLGEGLVPVWGHDGHVYMTAGAEIVRVPAQGGARETLVSLGEGETGHRVMDVLPGDTHLLRGVAGSGGVEIRILNLKTMEEKPLVFGLEAEVSPTGHLLYLADGALMAASLRLKAMELSGPAVPVMDGVQSYSLAADGTLFYTTGAGGGGTMVQPVWFNRSGEMTPIDPNWTFDRTANPNGHAAPQRKGHPLHLEPRR